MIDIKQIQEDPQRFKNAAETKGFDVDIDKLLELHESIKSAKQKIQDIATEKNRLGKSIPKLAGQQKQEALNKLVDLKQQEAGHNEQIKNLQPEFDSLMLLVAQPADDDVPFGKDDTQNVELRTEGTVRHFDFEPKDHIQLGLALDIIDVERGVKLAGTRNYFLKGDGALLHWAVLKFALDYMVARGYRPLVVPLLAKYEVMMGTGYYPGSEDQTYQVEKDELSLVGTAEVPLTAYHMGEILDTEQLPLKYVALSSCFRREAVYLFAVLRWK